MLGRDPLQRCTSADRSSIPVTHKPIRTWETHTPPASDASGLQNGPPTQQVRSMLFTQSLGTATTSPHPPLQPQHHANPIPVIASRNRPAHLGHIGLGHKQALTTVAVGARLGLV